MKYYHATTKERLDSIIENGLFKGFDDGVYLCDKPEYAARFLAVRLVNPIYVFEIDIPEENTADVVESFDHSETFFGCKAYFYPDDIPTDWIDSNYMIYERKE